MMKLNDSPDRKTPSLGRDRGQSDKGLDSMSPPTRHQTGNESIENSSSRHEMSRGESTSTVGSGLQQMKEEDSMAREKQEARNASENKTFNDEAHHLLEEVPWSDPRFSPTSYPLSPNEPKRKSKIDKASSSNGGGITGYLVTEESIAIRPVTGTRNEENPLMNVVRESIGDLSLIHSGSPLPTDSDHDERQIEYAQEGSTSDHQESGMLSAPRANETPLSMDGNDQPPTSGHVVENLAVATAVTSNADIEAQVRQNILEGAVQADAVPTKRQWRRWLAVVLVVLVIGVVVGVAVPLSTASGPTASSPSASFPMTQPSSSPTPTTFPSLSSVQELDVFVTISIRLDDFPTESGWRLQCGEVVHADVDTGSYFVQSQLITETFLVENGAACQFTMIDLGFASSGICCSSGNGFYRVFLGDDVSIRSNLVAEGGDLDGREEEEVVFLASPPAPTTSPAPSESHFPTLRPTFSLAPTAFSWMQLGQDIDGAVANGGFGESIALASDGMVLAAGAPFRVSGGNGGHVKVLKYNPAAMIWDPFGQVIEGEDASDGFGSTVSINQDGTVLAVGAPNALQNLVNPGYARVFHYDTTNNRWAPLGQRIDGRSFASCCVGDQLGGTVALNSDGSILAVGASAFNTGRLGYVRVFSYNATTNWTQMGRDIISEAVNDDISSVSLSADGTVLAIGSKFHPFEDFFGLVRVMKYVSRNSSWIQRGQDILGENKGDESGVSVSLSGDGLTLAIGALNSDESATNSGHARVFRYTSETNWTQIGQNIGGEFFSDQSGVSVSLASSGGVLAIGAPDNFDSGTDAGHARVYEYDKVTDSWIQTGKDTDGEAAGDQSGASVFLSGDGSIIGVGAPWNGGTGHVRVFTRN